MAGRSFITILKKQFLKVLIAFIELIVSFKFANNTFSKNFSYKFKEKIRFNVF